MSPIYPWTAATRAQLLQQRGRLPHALLLSGTPGLGKAALARLLAQDLLCDTPTPTGGACDNCRGCTLYAAGNHPDFQFVAPPEGSRIIAVEQIRALMDFVSMRPHSAACKVVVLAPAEAMNINAANSLLKMLEEPPPANFLLLVTHNAAALLPTIRSRCSRITLKPPMIADAVAWLEQNGVAPDAAPQLVSLARGAPLQALALNQEGALAIIAAFAQDFAALTLGAGDAPTTAARWKKSGAPAALEWLQRHLVDLIRARLSAAAPTALAPTLQARLNGLHLKQLFAYYDEVAHRRSLLGGPLDEQLLLEDTLIAWVRLITAAAKAA